jgi:hypothetical protein
MADEDKISLQTEKSALPTRNEMISFSLGLVAGCFLGNAIADTLGLVSHRAWFLQGITIAVSVQVTKIALELAPRSRSRHLTNVLSVRGIPIVLLAWGAGALGAYVRGEILANSSWCATVGMIGLFQLRRHGEYRFGCAAWLLGGLSLVGFLGIISVFVHG